MKRLIPLFVLVLPLIEIAGFVIVGRQIGVLATIGLVLLAAVVGGMMMRLQGLGLLNRLQRELEAGKDPGRELAHGAMVLLAGILLMVPGFFTDIVGLLLFVPPVRDLAWRFVRRRVQVTSFASFSAALRDPGIAVRPSTSMRRIIPRDPARNLLGGRSTGDSRARR